MSGGEKGIMMVVSAPSGTGKTTLCKELLRLYPLLRFSVSYTTRPPRPREIDGVDYRFVSPEEFAERDKQGEFIEKEEMFGHSYGTSRKDIEDILNDGGDVLIDVDTRGAKTLKEAWEEGVFIFILPPSHEVLRERLRRRGSEDESAIALRLSRAFDEINDNYWYDYVVFNDKLQNSVHILQSIYVAEKNRRIRQLDKLAEVIRSQGGN
ncbi:MAG: guanylate kinase [Syntrophales bacterium]|jgi:guanylate kinase|nr:guanylate kinase [Syntrophales bacterium]MCK9527056.1 guanylate kinase [Syntrophales bacterium]MDX9921819.1 guanylate kinase [Syntrophales bacterium]